MPPPVLQLKDIAVTLGGAPLLEGAELSIAPGDRIALVGRNGSGKSTLLRIAAGQTVPDRGTRFQQPTARLAFLPQEPDMSGHATLLDYVLADLPEHEDGYAARAMMDDLGLDPSANPANVSGGEARRAALARVLSAEPEILLLDEPTNHLDLIAIEWLESHLMSCRSALALVSHDRRLMADLTNATVWVDRGATHRLDRGFSAFEAWRDAKLEEEEAERHKLDRKIVAEEHWMRYGVTARRKRNMRRVGQLADLRSEKREARRSQGVATMIAQETKSSGALVVEADAVCLPGNVNGLAMARVVELPSAGVAVEDVIWFAVPAMPMVELARWVLARGKPNVASEMSVPEVLFHRTMSPTVLEPGPFTVPPCGSAHAMSGVVAIQKPGPPVCAKPTVMRLYWVPVPIEPLANALTHPVEAAALKKFFLLGAVVVVCTPTVCHVEPSK